MKTADHFHLLIECSPLCKGHEMSTEVKSFVINFNYVDPSRLLKIRLKRSQKHPLYNIDLLEQATRHFSKVQT